MRVRMAPDGGRLQLVLRRYAPARGRARDASARDPYQGSKRKLAPTIGRYLPKDIDTFYEPFAGSAAMTIYAAHHRRASRFVVADSLAPMIALLRAMVEQPQETADRYRDTWIGQRDGDSGYFNRVRDRYNNTGHHVDLLYLICRCVKNSVRFNRQGLFTQSVDKRRLGMHPTKCAPPSSGFRPYSWGASNFAPGIGLRRLRTPGRSISFIWTRLISGLP